MYLFSVCVTTCGSNEEAVGLRPNGRDSTYPYNGCGKDLGTIGYDSVEIDHFLTQKISNQYYIDRHLYELKKIFLSVI